MTKYFTNLMLLLMNIYFRRCVRSGWLLVHSLMCMERAWVQEHLPVFEHMWRSAFQAVTLPAQPALLIRNAVASAAAIHSFGSFARIHRRLLRSHKALGTALAPQLLRIVTLLDKDFNGTLELKEAVRLLQTVVVEAAVYMPLGAFIYVLGSLVLYLYIYFCDYFFVASYDWSLH